MSYTIHEFEEYEHCNFGIIDLPPFMFLKSASFVKTVTWYCHQVDSLNGIDDDTAKCIVLDMLKYILTHETLLQRGEFVMFRRALIKKLGEFRDCSKFTDPERILVGLYHGCIVEA